MSEVIHEPPAPAAEPPAAAEPVEEWTGPSREEWESQQAALGALIDHVSHQQAPEPESQPQQRPRFDPFADDVEAQLDAYIDARLAPLQQYQQYEQQAEAEERAYDILDDISSRLGEIEQREIAFPIIRAWADTKMPEMAQRYGFGPKAAEAALEASYSEFQQLFGAVGQTYTDRHINQLGRLGDLRAEPPAAPGATHVAEPPVQGDEFEWLNKRLGGFVPGQ